MNTTELFTDAFTRVADDLPRLLDGLGAEELSWRPTPDANPIGWLVWHLTRVQDDHLAGIAKALSLPGAEQVWFSGWARRFALPYPDEAHGYAMTSEQVAQFHVDGAQPLLDYHQQVHRATLELLPRLDEAALDAVVDTHWNPPVTAGVRLVSVVNDITQHAGQVAYVRGLLDSRA